MRKRTTLSVLAVLVISGLIFFQLQSWAAGESPAMRAPNCLSCHSYSQDQKLILGDFQSYSRQANLLTVKIGARSQIVKISDQTQLENAKSYRDLNLNNSLKIAFEEKPDGLYARKVTVKPPITVPKKQLISTKEMEQLIKEGPEKGQYLLLDSRPAYRFQEERLPGAQNMPLPNFDKLTHLLPADKGQMIIFYCQGFT